MNNSKSRCPFRWSRALCILALATLVMAPAAHAQVPLVDAGGKSLKDLIGTDTYITIILKGYAARDENLKVVDVGENYVSVLTLSGERTAYTFSTLQEIRVQNGRTHARRTSVRAEDVLSVADKSVSERAAEVAFNVFQERKDDQALVMRAASVIAAAGGDKSQGAWAYLRGLAASNNADTAIQASAYLYTLGEEAPVPTIQQGLASGNRKTRAGAARLVGLWQEESLSDAIEELLKDPTVDVFPSAARAAGQLNLREGIPILLRSVKALNQVKAEAAVNALVDMGGSEIRAALTDMLETSKGWEWFRVVKALFAMGDSEAQSIMRLKCLKEPAYAQQAALLLSESGDWEGYVYLRDLIDKSPGSTRESYLYRARVAAVLYESGYVEAKILLQKLLNLTENDIYISGKNSDKKYKMKTVEMVKISVCNLIAKSGSRSLMSVIEAAIENENDRVVIAACEAAIAIAKPEYRDRLAAARF